MKYGVILELSLFGAVAHFAGWKSAAFVFVFYCLGAVMAGVSSK